MILAKDLKTEIMQSFAFVLQTLRPSLAAPLPVMLFKACQRKCLGLFEVSPTASPGKQYSLAFAVVAAVTLLNLWLQNWIGYQAIALVYLLSVVVLSLFIARGPIFFGTVLTAAGWNYFFAPPAFAFNISDTYDNMMLLTYFVVTLTVAQLMSRLRAQRDAEVRAKLLLESERLGRTLLNSVSHELRTPIAAITTAVSSLRCSASLNGEQQNLMKEIDTASSRLNRLVQSLLSAARLQAGQIRPRLDWCDISDLVHIALRDVTELLSGHPVATKIAPAMPLVKADFVLLEQALANLIANAASHTPPGTAIQVRAETRNGALILEVADAGPGLSPDHLERVFEPFYRSDSAQRGAGVGLGLAIVRGFVETQGGSVRAMNRNGGGARFLIHLPLRGSPDLPDDQS